MPIARSSGAETLAAAPRSVRTSTIQSLPSIEPQPLGRQVVEPVPHQAVESQHIKTQHADAERDANGVTLGGVPRDVGADAGRLQGRVTPLYDFRNDARVPRPARR